MLTITVPCFNDLTTSVTLCLWSHKHLGILQEWWPSGSKEASAMTVVVTSTGTLGENKALSVLSTLYLNTKYHGRTPMFHVVQERLLTRSPKELCMDRCLSSDQCCSHKPLHSGTSSKSFWKVQIPKTSLGTQFKYTTSTYKVSVHLRNVLLPQMSHFLTHVLWRTHPMVSKKPTKKLLTFLDYSHSKPTPPAWKAAIYTLPLALWNLGKVNLFLHSMYCLQQTLQVMMRSPQSNLQLLSLSVTSLYASLSLVKPCQSQATKSHHVFVPLFPFAYLNKPTLTAISVSASTDVTIHCNWVVPGVQQIDTAPFLAEFRHCFPLLW